MNKIHILILVVVACMMLPVGMEAKKKKVDIYDLSLDDNLETPEIDNDKQSKRVQDYQFEVAVKLKKQNYDVELMRDNEVIVVTLPAGQLFAPNDTLLSSLGQVSLKPLLNYLVNPGFYKMLLVMHSDNTGSKQYVDNLTRSRVNAVFDWIDENASVDFVVPYALGASDPLNDNNSVDNRKRNRRLEIYLVPDEVMRAKAKKGRININLIQK
ncbi:MAG: OmpA family protein [Muribaculaceae bacterium]|nr:OmpA family protein [Muribaculaceae bacterium]